jgi:hypothetical protein
MCLMHGKPNILTFQYELYSIIFYVRCTERSRNSMEWKLIFRSIEDCDCHLTSGRGRKYSYILTHKDGCFTFVRVKDILPSHLFLFFLTIFTINSIQLKRFLWVDGRLLLLGVDCENILYKSNRFF